MLTWWLLSREEFIIQAKLTLSQDEEKALNKCWWDVDSLRKKCADFYFLAGEDGELHSIFSESIFRGEDSSEAEGSLSSYQITGFNKGAEFAFWNQRDAEMAEIIIRTSIGIWGRHLKEHLNRGKFHGEDEVEI